MGGNILHLGIKELQSLARDVAMWVLIIFTFTVSVYTAGTAMPETLHRAAIAVVDEDDSPLSARIRGAFYPPQFTYPQRLDQAEVDTALDAGRITFVLVIPPNFQRDTLAGKAAAVQLNVDATRMSQAFIGSGAIAQIVNAEVREFLAHHRVSTQLAIALATRVRFNPSLAPAGFGAIMELVNHVTLLSLILTGAALIREREHGTVEHLLVMPVAPVQIMLAKVWAMSLVVILATFASLTFIIRGALGVTIEGSILLFLVGVALHLFATSSLAIFMATLTRTMPQYALALMLTMMPLNMLSGGLTPRESMPLAVQYLMALSPTTHFTELSQAILYRGAGFDVVW
ncbi:MAG: hypothetical protein RIR70_214, partial [Pseudomonadota bacterium]